MTDNQIIWILIGVLVAVVFILPHIIMSRTIPKVIRILRRKNAVGADHAFSVDELGLANKPFFQRTLGPRDHKPKALQLLIKMGVAKYDDKGRVYLCEQELAKTKWSHL